MESFFFSLLNVLVLFLFSVFDPAGVVLCLLCTKRNKFDSHRNTVCECMCRGATFIQTDMFI